MATIPNAYMKSYKKCMTIQQVIANNLEEKVLNKMDQLMVIMV
jgi:hypothetical protein